MTPTANASVSVEAVLAGAGNPPNDAPATIGLLAVWAKAKCPHLKSDGRCRIAVGPCRLLGPTVSACRWAEGGPILLAPQDVLDAYCQAVTPKWMRKRPRVDRRSSARPSPPPQPGVEEAAVREEPAAVRQAPKPPPIPPRTPPGSAGGDWFAQACDVTEVEAACLDAGQVVERLCRDCGQEPLLPRQRLCDRCRDAAKRATKRKAQAKWRRTRYAPRPV